VSLLCAGDEAVCLAQVVKPLVCVTSSSVEFVRGTDKVDLYNKKAVDNSSSSTPEVDNLFRSVLETGRTTEVGHEKKS